MRRKIPVLSSGIYKMGQIRMSAESQIELEKTFNGRSDGAVEFLAKALLSINLRSLS
jgi:hypothetical protein